MRFAHLGPLVVLSLTVTDTTVAQDFASLNYQAKVVSVNPTLDFLFPGVEVGGPATVSLTLDLEAPDGDPDPVRGDYLSQGVLPGMTITIAGTTIRSADLSVVVQDDVSSDSVRAIGSLFGTFPNDICGSVHAVDRSATSISSPRQPSSTATLAGFDLRLTVSQNFVDPVLGFLITVPLLSTDMLTPVPDSTFVEYAGASAGVSGVPMLTGSGLATAGVPFRYDITNAAPSAPCALVFGFSRIDSPFLGGLLVPNPDIVLPLTTDPSGAEAVVILPHLMTPGGLELSVQAWIQDPVAPGGLAASCGLGVTFR